ncbi:MAG: sigma-70 family RNA polymerase sigma factor [Planctomycetales bacterium]|nr:sigma-70 family RNA polymerase sigma factor [Planctomycetales bacterium]
MGLEKIGFIPNDDFVSACEQDFADIDCQLYADDGQILDQRTSDSIANSFLVAVSQSRILTAEGEVFLFKRLNFLRFRANALKATLKSGRSSKATTKEIERLLEEANHTREQIACANLRLVSSIVRKLTFSNEEFDEYLAEANAILLNAIDKFDYSRGYRFSTYVTHAVQRHTFRLIERNRKQRERECSQADSNIENYAASEVDDDESRQMDQALKSIMASFHEILDEREQRIVRSRFGLDGTGKSKSMRIIGDELGLSKERVRQILNNSIEKLAKFALPLDLIQN